MGRKGTTVTRTEQEGKKKFNSNALIALILIICGLGVLVYPVVAKIGRAHV